MNTITLLKLVLVLIGSAIALLGLNIGLGGIRTLGWQIPQDFIAITNADIFQTQDSHIRFIGGVWFGIGVLFLGGALMLDQLRSSLIALCAVIAVAGLFRLSATNLDVIMSAAIAPSLIFEIVGFPLLSLWLMRSTPATKTQEA